MKRALIAVTGISIAFIVFATGYLFGQMYRQDSFYITTEKGVDDFAVNGPDELAPVEDKEQLRININTASVDELCLLPGIGPVIARRIVDYRNEYGSFMYAYEIMNIPGIGEKTYENLRLYIYVS